ncbi:MAG: glycosyltransferase family 4 protein [Burkholderiales bacterium]|nr:glycosyltransferase family 4 protein [Burkholderiales bacterium]
MNIVLLTHPAWLVSYSMPRFADMLVSGLRQRGHTVQTWAPAEHLRANTKGGKLAKWAGYADQYLLFPRWVRRAIERQPADTLFVFADQALGPWVPLVGQRPHVVHCHDLLALRSALGMTPEHHTHLPGRIYQRYIRRGFRQARHFISVSDSTRQDMVGLGGVRPLTNEVVYNGLSHPFAPMSRPSAQAQLARAGLPVAEQGMLLHVGGNQWYKNPIGVVRLYAAYAQHSDRPLPLWMITPPPDPSLRQALARVPPRGEVLFFENLDNDTLQAAYSLARALLFPSLAEGFGWPLVEAQACGCPVLTTDAAPMNEVAGPEACLVPRPSATGDSGKWARLAAQRLQQLLDTPPRAQQLRREACIAWTARFNGNLAIDAYERIYRRVIELEAEQAHPGTAHAVRRQ